MTKSPYYRIEFKQFDPDIPEAGGMDVALTPEGHYIGTPDIGEFLCDKCGIRPELAGPRDSVCSIGFCEREQKWYGWSHRAIFGFGIGHTVERGDCGYIADTPEGLIEDRGDFFADLGEASRERHMAECQILPDRSGIRVLHAPLVIPMASKIDDALEYIAGAADAPDLAEVDLHDGENAFSIEKCGRGEWTAETLDDARQMAIDFAESVG